MRGDFWLFDENCTLLRFDGAAFGAVGTAQGLPGNRVCELLRRADGRIVVATDHGAAQQHGDRFGTIAAGDIDAAVTHLFEASDGCLWIGDVRARAFRVCGDTVTETYTLPGSGDGLRITSFRAGVGRRAVRRQRLRCVSGARSVLVPVAGSRDTVRTASSCSPTARSCSAMWTGACALLPERRRPCPSISRSPVMRRMTHAASNGERWFNAGNYLEHDGRRYSRRIAASMR